MIFVAFDCETDLVQPGLSAPPLVCAAYATEDGEAHLLTPEDARNAFRVILRSSDVLCNAFLAYDVAVMLADARSRSLAEYEELVALVFAKYKRGEVHDVLLAQALDAVAGGHLHKLPNGGDLRDPVSGEIARAYSLSLVTWLVLGRKDAKANDYWRKRYAILRHVPMEDWPEDAKQYPLDDVRNALEIALVQRGGPRQIRKHQWEGANPEYCIHCFKLDTGKFEDVSPDSECVERTVSGKPHRNVEGVARECRAELALHLGAVWGLRTDPEWVGTLESKTKARAEDYERDHAELYRRGHEPGCLKRMEAAGVTPEQAKALGPRLGPDGKQKAPTVHCVTSCTDGKEDGPKIARMVAEAYGATGECVTCGGTGRVTSQAKGNQKKCERCFGHGKLLSEEATLRLLALPDVTCDACSGVGWILGSTTIGCAACSSTGLDVSNPSVPRTDTGGVRCDRDAKEESGHELLMSFADDEHESVAKRYIPFLKLGMDYPLCLRPNTILETLRTSYRGVIQQMPRQGDTRASFVARPGYVYCSADYSGIELCTLAQVCRWFVGFSCMGDIINESGDPGRLHAVLGAQMLGLPIDEFIRRYKAKDKQCVDVRQAAKPGNFGFGGRMGPPKFVLANRKKSAGTTVGPDGHVYAGVRFCILLGGAERCGAKMITTWGSGPRAYSTAPVCEACCQQAARLKATWMRTFDEMPHYFDWVQGVTESHCEVRLPFPGCVRGGVQGNDAANGPFQQLAAMGAKHALWLVSQECYSDPKSVLYGSRPVFFVHDEQFLEISEECAHEAAYRVAELMVQGMREYVPDIAVKVEPALMRSWQKGADPAFRDGRLIPWEDRDRA